jgi:segregation and condensation protein A
VNATIEGDGPRPDGAGDGRCEVDLPQFEGPLDLLLHLVRRHELDILDIPISFVCEKYLEYLEVMRALDLETAGEYLVMAATLAYLKSRELVPQAAADPTAVDGVDEGGPDPRAELIARLLEYQRYRAAAAELDRMPVSGRDVFDRGGTVDVEPLDSGLAPITLYRLAEAYHRVLDRARVLKTHEVVIARVSVSARMKQLTALLLERSRFDFEQIFLERTWTSEHELRAMLIVTLMSVLELVRLGVARVHQPEGADVLLIERAATAEEAERALSDYDENASFGQPPPPAPEPDEDADDPFDEDFDDADASLLGLDTAVRPEPEAVQPAQTPAGAPVEAPTDDPLASADAVAQNASGPAAANGPEPANEPTVANEPFAANGAAAANHSAAPLATPPATSTPDMPDDGTDDDDGR